jgi:hypothetical protein
MNALSDEELKHRLAALSFGPWQKRPTKKVAQIEVRTEPARGAALPGLYELAEQTGYLSDASAVHFAAFLAHLRAFYADEAIGAWTRFLDGEAREPAEHAKLRAYLRGKRRSGPLRTGELLHGARLFVASLAGAFDLVADADLAAFARIHAHWLQKFFAGDSWARLLAASARVLPPDVDAATARLLRREFARQVKALLRPYDVVRVVERKRRSR